MAIDPIASALDAIVTHLDTEVATLASVLRGWPEHRVDLDLSGGPVVAVVAGEAPEERINPIVLGSADDGDGGLVVTYKVANLVIPVQIDVWAAYRSQLDDAVAAIDAALANQVPATSSLWLTQANYYGRPLSGTVTGFRRADDAETAELGQWRATWNLEVVTDKVAQTTHPTITRIVTTITAQIAEDEDRAVSESFTTP